MRRFAAQILFCAPEKIIKNGMVELSENGIVSKTGELSTLQSEPSETIFLNGIILPFCPETQAINTSDVMECLKHQFANKECAPIAAGEPTSLWLLSGETLFQGGAGDAPLAANRIA